MADDKSTIYLDVDDDITAIIGKINQAATEHVNLVIPKRSTVLQSAVNLKLIKKSTAQSRKQLVLITEDAQITKIAAGQKMLVAPNLQTDPKVLEAEPLAQTHIPSDVIEGQAGPEQPAVPVAPVPVKTEPKAEPAKPNSDEAKKRRLPDFNRFKKRFFLALLGAVAGIAGLWFLILALPRATILIEGNTEPLAMAVDFTADTEVENPQYDNELLGATRPEVDKTFSKTFTATGKKNVGSKAKGDITIKNCEDTDSRALSAGTRFVSPNGKGYLSQEDITVPEGDFSNGGQNCDSESVTVPVAAEKNGSSYNTGEAEYTSGALSGDFRISGSEMTGGSSKIINVVTKEDVERARKELLSNERNSVKQELEEEFARDDYVIADSFTANVKKETSSPAVGQEATTAELALEVTYTQIGVKEDQLEELITRRAEAKIRGVEDKASLGVVSAGLVEARISLKDKPSANSYRFHINTKAQLGPDINFDELKERLAGKKLGEAVEIVKSYPNVTNAEVKLSPFYVRKVPANPAKVEVEIKLPKE